MEDAESKIKKGRIRHCYPRQEVYHRFIHDNNYYYSNQAHAISSKGNYLSLGDIGRNRSVADIEEYWYPGNRIFSVIDRENKKILVSHKYSKLTYELIRSIPNDYEIFHCNDDIPFHNILACSNIDTLSKLHLQYAIELYVERYLRPFYACCNGKRILHNDIDSIIKDSCHNNLLYYEREVIEKFVKKYKVKKRTWYKETLNPKFKLCIYYPTSWNFITIELPSVKKILTNTVFNKHQKDIFRKKYFYSTYCYGRGIYYNDVDKYYNKTITNAEAINYCNKNNIYLNTDWLVDISTWNDLISKTKEIEDKAYKNYIDKQIAKSEENYKYALEELHKLESEYTVNAWREGQFKNSQLSVSYQKFNAPSRRNKTYGWTTTTIRSNNKTFTNTQLKLEGNTIRTSRNASVTLEEGIKMYKMFKIGRANNPSCTSWTERNFGKVNVGIYNLRFITYKEKTTDTGVKLGRKEWCIQIGCHALWLDDIEDFIRCYHLEDKFNSKNN